MADIDKREGSKVKSSKKFNNFGEYLYYAYANLQMLCYALNSKTPKYDRKSMFVGQLPVPEDISSLENLTDQSQIDDEVYRLYNLSDEEVKYIK